jgi:hypothetical protein
VDSLVGSLVDKRVLTRGYPLKCERCPQIAWYSLDDIGVLLATTSPMFSELMEGVQP